MTGKLSQQNQITLHTHSWKRNPSPKATLTEENEPPHQGTANKTSKPPAYGNEPCQQFGGPRNRGTRRALAVRRPMEPQQPSGSTERPCPRPPPSFIHPEDSGDPKRKGALLTVSTTNIWGKSSGSRKTAAFGAAPFICSYAPDPSSATLQSGTVTDKTSPRTESRVSFMQSAPYSLKIYCVFLPSSSSLELRKEERMNRGFNSRPKSNEKGKQEEGGEGGRLVEGLSATLM